MNATEDGDEPVGEAPEYVTITVPPREGLTSLPVLGENERQAIAEIRHTHYRSCDCGVCESLGRIPFCVKCQADWPCDDIRILDKWGV